MLFDSLYRALTITTNSGIIIAVNKVLNPPSGIVIKPEIRFGQPTVAGTRVAIADILSLVEAGYHINDISAQYPAVTLPAAKKALGYAAAIC